MGVEWPYPWFLKRHEIRRLLGEAQNWRCAYCGIPVSDDNSSWDKGTIDHIVPRKLGGRRVWTNLVMACRACNESRRDMDAEQFYALRQVLLNCGWVGAGKRFDMNPSRKSYPSRPFIVCSRAAP